MTAPLGLGIVGAGGFATFVAESVASMPSVTVRAVADARLDAAERLASSYGARATGSVTDLLADDRVDAVVVATPPVSHAAIATVALEAGKHVFCEKPLALDDADARDLVEAVRRTGRVLVVDHVLRYNPLLRALQRLRGPLLGPVQRFCFENDASDEDLEPGHWFWDEGRSGGIFVEHGVHFFDAAAMLVDAEAESVQGVAASRADGTVDLVSATVSHGSALATHTHSFTHPHRCERQLMRLDCGPAEVRIEGWIPVHAVLDAWTDDAGLRVARGLPDRVAQLLHVDGFRLGPRAGIRVTAAEPDAAPARARGRGVALDLPHHVRVELTLGGHEAKQEAYAESVRAAMTDLVGRIADHGRPASGVREGAAAVAVATAATRAARLGSAQPLVADATGGFALVRR